MFPGMIKSFVVAFLLETVQEKSLNFALPLRFVHFCHEFQSSTTISDLD